MKQLILFCMWLTAASFLILNVKASSDFCSAYNLIKHIQSRFINQQNITDLLVEIQKESAKTVQHLYMDIKQAHMHELNQAVEASADNSQEKNNLNKLGHVFGENWSQVYGSGDLFNLCELSTEYDNIFDLLSIDTQFIVGEMTSQLDSLFNLERGDIFDRVLAKNADIVLALKEQEAANMHHLVNIIQIYKEISVPDYCGFQKRSDKIREKFLNKDKVDELLLGYQKDLATLVRDSVVPKLSSSRKWLIAEIMIQDATQIDALYRLIEKVTYSVSQVDFCEFKEDFSAILAQMKPENQLILEQLEINFYEILFEELARVRDNFAEENRASLAELDDLEPYNTHELGDFYNLWRPKSAGNACVFQTNLNAILNKFSSRDGRQYIREFIVNLQIHLRDEAEKAFLRLEIQNEISLRPLLDKSEQDSVHYEKLKRTLFDETKFDAVYDVCTMASMVTRISSRFLRENVAMVERLVSIVIEDLFEKRVDAIYADFLGKNANIVDKLKETPDMRHFLQVCRIYGLLKRSDSAELFQIILEYKK